MPNPLTHPPDICALWNKGESRSETADKRLKMPGYTIGAAGLPCWLQVLSVSAKAALGFVVTQSICRLWLPGITYATTANIGDVVIVGSDSYQISEWIVYNYGPARAQHIEAVCERMPTIPVGITE